MRLQLVADLGVVLVKRDDDLVRRGDVSVCFPWFSWADHPEKAMLHEYIDVQLDSFDVDACARVDLLLRHGSSRAADEFPDLEGLFIEDQIHDARFGAIHDCCGGCHSLILSQLLMVLSAKNDNEPVESILRLSFIYSVTSMSDSCIQLNPIRRIQLQQLLFCLSCMNLVIDSIHRGLGSTGIEVPRLSSRRCSRCSV